MSQAPGTPFNYVNWTVKTGAQVDIAEHKSNACQIASSLAPELFLGKER